MQERNKKAEHEAEWKKEVDDFKAAQTTSLYKRIQQQKCARHMSEKRILKQYQDYKQVLDTQPRESSAKKHIKVLERAKSARVVRPRPNTAMAEHNTVSSAFHGKISLKEYRAKIHPPSKLVLSDREKLVERQVTMKADEHLLRSEVEKAYKIDKNKDGRYIDERKFIDTYSKGPYLKRSQVRNSYVGNQETEDKSRSRHSEVLARY